MKNYKLKKLWEILKPYIEMEKTIIKYGDIEIKNQKFHEHKITISIDNIDVDEIAVSKRIILYFLLAMKMRRDFYKTKCMMFLIKDEKLLQKYNKIWEKVCNIIKNKFVIKPVYNKQYLNYLKTKIKVYNKKKPIQVSVVIKYQRKIHNVFAYQ